MGDAKGLSYDPRFYKIQRNWLLHMKKANVNHTYKLKSGNKVIQKKETFELTWSDDIHILTWLRNVSNTRKLKSGKKVIQRWKHLTFSNDIQILTWLWRIK